MLGLTKDVRGLHLKACLRIPFLFPAPEVNQLGENICEVTWEPLQPMRGDSIVYILQLTSGREIDQVTSIRLFLKFYFWFMFKLL